jgi:hypothetical protein
MTTFLTPPPSVSDTIANLVVQNLGTGAWEVTSAVIAGQSVTVTDSTGVNAAPLLAILSAIHPSDTVQLILQNAPGISGMLDELRSLIEATPLGHFFLENAPVLHVYDSVVDARAVVDFFAQGYDSFIDRMEMSAATGLRGSIADVLEVIGMTNALSLSGSEYVHLTDVSIAGLADVPSVASQTSGTVTVVSLADTIAHLGIFDSVSGHWTINPAVGVGADVTVTDSGEIPAGFLVDLLSATEEDGYVSAPNATAVRGTLVEFGQIPDADLALPAGVHYKLSDTSLYASNLTDFINSHATRVLDAASVTTLSGSIGEIRAALLETNLHFSGGESFHVTNSSLADFAAARAELDPQTTGAVTALLYDTVDNLVSQNPSTHAWSAKAGIGAGFSIQIQYDPDGVTMAAGAVLALVAKIGVAGDNYVNVTTVNKFTGSVAEVLQLSQAQVQTTNYGVVLGNSTVNATDLITIKAHGADDVDATSAIKLSGTVADLDTVFADGHFMFSLEEDVDVTSPVTVAELLRIREEHAGYTAGNFTGALRDSVLALTGHTAEAGGGGYTVIDTVATVLAHGSVVAGAAHVELADSIAHLIGKTTAGNATHYTVVDTLDDLADTGPSAVVNNAQAIILADSVANLTGHTTEFNATGYILVDTLGAVSDSSAAALLSQAGSVTLTDSSVNASDLEQFALSNYYTRIDASAVQTIQGNVSSLIDSHQGVLAGGDQVPLLSLSGHEAVRVSDTATVAEINAIDGYTTGAVSAGVEGSAADLLTVHAAGNAYDFNITDAVSLSDLTTLEARGGDVSYYAVTDSAAHLGSLSGGVWTFDSHLHDNMFIAVTGDIGADELAALVALNAHGTVLMAVPAATDHLVATADQSIYDISSGMVANVIDIAGDQIFRIGGGIDSPPGVLNLSGTDGRNTIVFDDYRAPGQGGPQLMMTQSGTTAIFWDAGSHTEVAAISMDLQYGATQDIEFNDGSYTEITLTGTAHPVITMGAIVLAP